MSAPDHILVGLHNGNLIIGADGGSILGMPMEAYIRKDASDAAIAAARAEGVPSKEAIYALALRMWAVHPKDLDAAGYGHVSRGGKYENPRAAWYADQIEALFRAAAEAQP